MANQFSKKQIDFDVYERANPESQVDWSQAAKDITDKFETIRDDRQTRKDDLLKSYQEQQEELNNLGEYDSPTTQQLVMNAGSDAAEKMTNYRDLMTRGLVKPSDMNMFEHNVSSGFTLLKKNALAYDTLFKEVALRTKEGDNSATEQWRTTLLESFGRLENAQIQTNPETGALSFLRVEPPFKTDESGNKVKNPNAGQPVEGGSMSLQQMTLLMKQKTDSIDIEKKIKAIKDNLGDIVLASTGQQGRKGTVSTVEMSRLETQFFESPEGKEYLRLKASELQVGEDAATLITQTNQVNSNGENFKPGTEDEHKKWEEDNKDKGTTTFDVPALKDKSEGDAFRQWVNNNYAQYAQDNDLDPSGSFDNEFINEAYSKYGEEYARDVLKIEGTTTKAVNPVLIQNFENQSYTTDLTPEQRGVSDKVAMDQVTIALDYKEKVAVSYRSPNPRSPGIQKWQWDAQQDAKQYRTYAELTDAYDLAKKSLQKGYSLTAEEETILQESLTALAGQSDNAMDIEFNEDEEVFVIIGGDNAGETISFKDPDSKKYLAQYVYGTSEGGKQEYELYEEEEKKYNAAEKKNNAAEKKNKAAEKKPKKKKLNGQKT